MEQAFRFVIVFLWCVCFGFFSVMGYLDDTMTTRKTTPLLVWLLAGLGVYCAIEWSTKNKGFQAIAKKQIVLLYTRLSHGIRVCVTSINLPTWNSIKKRFLPTDKPSISSKGT